MILEAVGQTVDFFGFDHSMHDNIYVSFSGGTDSSLLLYLICTHLSDKRIVAHTGTDLSKDPFVKEYAEDIMIWMRKQFPHLNIVHEQYDFNSRDPVYIQQASKEISEAKDKSIFPSVLGHAKSVAQREYKSEMRKKYKMTMSTHGITANPPIEVQKELGFEHVAESRRNQWYDPIVVSPSGKNIHHKPFVNVDKRWVAGMYEKLGLMDELFPLTMSCIGDNEDSKYYTEPCKKCFWCHEKLWAFGCYDGGLKA